MKTAWEQHQKYEDMLNHCGFNGTYGPSLSTILLVYIDFMASHSPYLYRFQKGLGADQAASYDHHHNVSEYIKAPSKSDKSHFALFEALWSMCNEKNQIILHRAVDSTSGDSLEGKSELIMLVLLHLSICLCFVFGHGLYINHVHGHVINF